MRAREWPAGGDRRCGGAVARSATGWRGLGGALADGPCRSPGMPDEAPLGNPRARKMMSRGGVPRGALPRDCSSATSAGPRTSARRAGYFLGVGASGGSLDDVIALLDASIADGAFSLARFGDAGPRRVQPAARVPADEQLHAVPRRDPRGLGGPNSALFSRGAGTTVALLEAVHAIRRGDCERALAGGADSALHPVTRAELGARWLHRARPGARGGRRRSSRSRPARAGLATIEGAAIASGGGGGAAAARSCCRRRWRRSPRPWRRPAVRRGAGAGASTSSCSRRGDRRAARRSRVGEDRGAVGERRRRLPPASARRSPPRPALAWVAALDLLVARTRAPRARARGRRRRRHRRGGAHRR